MRSRSGFGIVLIYLALAAWLAASAAAQSGIPDEQFDALLQSAEQDSQTFRATAQDLLPTTAGLSLGQQEILQYRYAKSLYDDKQYAEARRRFNDFLNQDFPNQQWALEAVALELLCEYQLCKTARIEQLDRMELYSTADISDEQEAAVLEQFRAFIERAEALSRDLLQFHPGAAQKVEEKIWIAKVVVGREDELLAAAGWSEAHKALLTYARACAYYYFKPSRLETTHELFETYLQNQPDGAKAGQARLFRAKTTFQQAKYTLQTARDCRNDNVPEFVLDLEASANILLKRFLTEAEACLNDPELSAENKAELREKLWQADFILQGDDAVPELSAESPEERERYQYAIVLARYFNYPREQAQEMQDLLANFASAYPASPRGHMARYYADKVLFIAAMDYYSQARSSKYYTEHSDAELVSSATRTLQQFLHNYEEYHAALKLPEKFATDYLSRYQQGLFIVGRDVELTSGVEFTIPELARLQFAQAKGYYQANQWDQLLTVGLGYALNPDFPTRLRYDVANDYLRTIYHQGDYEKLRQKADQILAASEPATDLWTTARYHQGKALYGLQQYDDAATLFEQLYAAPLDKKDYRRHTRTWNYLKTIAIQMRIYCAIARQNQADIKKFVDILIYELPESSTRTFSLNYVKQHIR